MKPFLRVAAFLVVTVVLMAACSNPPASSSETSARSSSETTSPPGPGSMSVGEGQVRGAQVLEGRVLFEGSTIPRSTRVENTTDPQDCETIQSLSNIIISRENRGIKNVILALKDVPLPKDYRPQPSPLILDNRNCQFEPHVAVLTTGSSIEAVNRDPIFHSVHLYGFLNVNLALGPNQSKVVQTLERPGYVIVKCDVHGWMQAFFRVDNHPFHAVSDTNGRFQIRGIPEGSYTLEVWHEYFGEQKLAVTVKGGKTVTLEIEYPN